MNQVRLITDDGSQAGIVNIRDALAQAKEVGLDLVEVSPNAVPPVCRIMDFGKYLYEQSKRAKAAKKKQHATEMKEMRLSPKTDEHDYLFKVRHMREFLSQGNKVKVSILFKGREISHTEFGKRIMERIQVELVDIMNVESAPSMEGKFMNMILAPKSRK